MGLYVICKDGADEEEEPEYVGVVLLHYLRSVPSGCALPLDWFTHSLSYVLMNLDGKKLSLKVQTLKIKMLQ